MAATPALRPEADQDQQQLVNHQGCQNHVFIKHNALSPKSKER